MPELDEESLVEDLEAAGHRDVARWVQETNLDRISMPKSRIAGKLRGRRGIGDILEKLSGGEYY